jgi:hypothetical protein
VGWAFITFAAAALSERYAVAWTLLWEVRSFAKRICVLRDKNNRRVCESRYLPLGPLYEEDALSGRLLLCKKTISRNESIERMLAKFPWASGSDVFLFLYGWEMGKECSLDNVCNKNTETELTSVPPA